MPHVSRGLRAFVPHVPRGLRALVPTVPLFPTCLVPQVPRAQRNPVFHMPGALCGLVPCTL